MNTDKPKPFVIEQLDEALEERQNPERRKGDKACPGDLDKDRRKVDRRTMNKQANQ